MTRNVEYNKRKKVISILDVSGRVYHNIKSGMAGICDNVVNTDGSTEASFPTVGVTQVDNPEIGQDLENNENAVLSSIDINVYSNVSAEEAGELSATAADYMRRMGYQRVLGPQPVYDEEKTQIYRILARYQRVICELNDVKENNVNI